MSYNYGTVYRIVCLSDPDIQYVGSTFNDIHQRYKTHKRQYTAWKNGKSKSGEISLYPYIKDNWKNFKILPIKRYLVYREHNKDRKHLESYEQLWISKLKCVNKNNPFRIGYLYRKQYYEENKEEIAMKKKQYNEENKEKIAMGQKQYREENKEKIAMKKKQYQEEHKEYLAKYMKQYREENKEEIAKKKKQYREENKDKIKAQRSNKMTCICGSSFNKDSRARHNRTMKHQNYINNQ